MKTITHNRRIVKVVKDYGVPGMAQLYDGGPFVRCKVILCRNMFKYVAMLGPTSVIDWIDGPSFSKGLTLYEGYNKKKAEDVCKTVFDFVKENNSEKSELDNRSTR